MNAFKVRAAVTALFLGVAAAGAVCVSVVPADAAVRAVVGKPLNEAKNLAASGNYSAAMAKVHEAEGASGLTGEERNIISQMKEYIAVKSGGAGEVNSAIGAKAKFAADFRAGKWGQVIADADMLRKYGALDGQSMAAIAGAYYRSGNNAGCVRYIRSNFGSGAGEEVLRLQMTCAYGAGDDEAQTSALQELVGRTGKPEYWSQLLKAAERTRGLKDHQTLDIYRLKLLTGSLAGDDYITLTTLALQFNCSAEAVSVAQKGIAANAIKGERAQRLLKTAQDSAARDQAGFAAAMAAAQKGNDGDALVKLGESLWGEGKFKDGIAAVQAGLSKSKVDADNAEIRLGMNYLGGGQKPDAERAFDKVKTDPKQTLIAHLWALYARK
jgi:hypothetical protein